MLRRSIPMTNTEQRPVLTARPPPATILTTNEGTKQALIAKPPPATIPTINTGTKQVPIAKPHQVTIPMISTETKQALTEEILTVLLPNTTNTGTKSEPIKQIRLVKQHTMTSTEEK